MGRLDDGGLERGGLYQVWCSEVAHRALAPTLGDELFRRYHAWREPFQCGALPEMLGAGEIAGGLLGEALDDAVAELRATLAEDPDDWRWETCTGSRSRTRSRRSRFESLFVALEAGVGGDDQTVLQTGWTRATGIRRR